MKRRFSLTKTIKLICMLLCSVSLIAFVLTPPNSVTATPDGYQLNLRVAHLVYTVIFITSAIVYDIYSSRKPKTALTAREGR